MPSAANFARREAERLASLTFFLDYQIGRYLVAEALRAAGAHVEVHIDHYEQAAPDVEWIPEVGRREWVLITKRMKIFAAIRWSAPPTKTHDCAASS